MSYVTSEPSDLVCLLLSSEKNQNCSPESNHISDLLLSGDDSSFTICCRRIVVRRRPTPPSQTGSRVSHLALLSVWPVGLGTDPSTPGPRGRCGTLNALCLYGRHITIASGRFPSFFFSISHSFRQQALTPLEGPSDSRNENLTPPQNHRDCG